MSKQTRLSQYGSTTILEMLVLADARLVGSVSLYSLVKKLDLSTGTTAPALQRLTRDKLLKKAPKNGRGQEYLITAAGNEVLESWVSNPIGNAPTSSAEDALRRSALFSRIGTSEEKRIAVGLLASKASQLKEQSAQWWHKAQQVHLEKDGIWSSYLGMSYYLKSCRLLGEAEGLDGIVASLGRTA
jgi:DNA-binding PadR family transcriptional regulator